jgi:hypothetical protein
LQLLPPTHFTLAWLVEFPEELCASTGAVRNIAPTAAARAAPAIVLRSIVITLLSGLPNAGRLDAVYAFTRRAAYFNSAVHRPAPHRRLVNRGEIRA